MSTSRNRTPALPAGIVSALLLALVIGWGVWTGADIGDTLGSGTPTPTTHSQATAPTDDYTTTLGAAQIIYDATPGQVQYCDLDDLGRAVCAYGLLTPTLRNQAQEEGRQNINVNPAGWGTNSEVLIPATSTPGSRDYHGWFWNRSHLVADSLGGEASKTNLITGTRTQNVGSTQVGGQYAGGMAQTELLARNYLDAQHDDSCPLYYSATPVYNGDDLIPVSVLVDVRSCDGSIDQRVEVSNTANGWEVDYANGTFTPAN